MSKIDDLIAKYCPDGVEWKELGEVCEFKRGKTITAKNAIEGDVPVIAGGQKPSYYHNEANRTGETISISSSGAYAGFVNYWTIPVFLSDSFSVEVNHDILNTKYVFYYLKSKQEEIHNTKKGSGVPHVHGSSIAKFQIPIPPLPVQEEIVSILDKFTALEAELEAELEARTRQYEYYRNELLSFDGKDVEWKALGELYDFKNGLNKGKEFFGKGTPIINFTDVFKNRSITKDKLKGTVEVNDIEIQRYNAKVNDLFFTRTSEVREEIGMASVLLEDIEDCVFSGFVLRARPKTSLHIPKFISYYLMIPHVRNEIIRHSSFTTRGLTSGPKLSKIQLPIPPIEEQERIVAILDKFDALVNDISTGLPAEIQARRQQYEYYRGKLLTFEPLTA